MNRIDQDSIQCRHSTIQTICLLHGLSYESRTDGGRSVLEVSFGVIGQRQVPSAHCTDFDVGFQHRTTEDITWACIA